LDEVTPSLSRAFFFVCGGCLLGFLAPGNAHLQRGRGAEAVSASLRARESWHGGVCVVLASLKGWGKTEEGTEKGKKTIPG